MPLAQTIGLDTLSKYFHLPINDVAKELGVCATVLKKICRKNGIPRWPHRKIKSLDKMIVSLELSVAKNPEDEERIRHEISTLRNKKMFLMKNPNVLATKAPSTKKNTKAPSEAKSPESTESGAEEDDEQVEESPVRGGGGAGGGSAFPYPPPYAPGAHYNTAPSFPPPPSYAKSNAGPPYAHYPPFTPPPTLPPAYEAHHQRYRESERLSPSMVLDPVSTAMYLQLPHPYLPHPLRSPHALPYFRGFPLPPPIPFHPMGSLEMQQQQQHHHAGLAEKAQWPPSMERHPASQNEHLDHQHASAFTPLKSFNGKYPPIPSSLPFTAGSPHAAAHYSSPHTPHYSSPHSPSVSPRSHSASSNNNNYYIQLPELRLPEEKDKPKLSTLEPDIYAHNRSPSVQEKEANTDLSPFPQ